jgi:hypothetical protein
MDPITPAGRIAAFVTAGCCLLLGLGLGWAFVDELLCDTKGCEREAAAAALLMIIALGLVAFSVGVLRQVVKRPVQPDGFEGWYWGLGAVFFLSAFVTAVLVPAATCPQGGKPDQTLGMCLLGHDRLPMTSLAWLEWLIIAGGIGGAVLLARFRRHVWLNVAACLAAFSFATTWMLVRIA